VWSPPVTTPVTTSTPSDASNPSTDPNVLDDLDAHKRIDARRTRLRALWTEWSVEVRVLSGALESPAWRGFFLPRGQFVASVRRIPLRTSRRSVKITRRSQCPWGQSSHSGSSADRPMGLSSDQWVAQ
jgi:hypothetical protein